MTRNKDAKFNIKSTPYKETKKKNMINYNKIYKYLTNFKKQFPFDHVVIDNFFDETIANKISNEFLDYNSKEWYVYENAIEHKKALNNWNLFPELTYKVFSELNSDKFINMLSDSLELKLYPDSGLHGGGWHMHGNGGNLNPHLDYSIHPKLKLQRKLNIIVYLSKELKEEHGGHLGLWTHCAEMSQPKNLVKEVEPIFNRAVIFDTTQNSWHGMSRKLSVPEDVFRKSLAVYYLCDPAQDADQRGRALFAPREEQKNDSKILNLIDKRSDVKQSLTVYKN
ncbi:MAG: 2OG-Fe(II) oxygenase [Candidatus Paracaedibacteraceae bacterium]|nr:2OG-Fe(II) oxygenase [Candidatus Paracaedibacteraceae bacterium]